MKRITANEIADTIKEARINDDLKKQLIISLAKAKVSMSDIEFIDLFTKIKKQISQKEKELN